MRVIIKNPGEKVGHFEEIENELIPMKKIVGGPIEAVYLGRGLVMVVNEEGKLWMLPENFRTEHDIIVGTAIVAGTCGDEFADCPISLNLWKKKLARWGNDVGEIPLTDIRTRFTSYKVDFLSTDTYLADGSRGSRHGTWKTARSQPSRSVWKVRALQRVRLTWTPITAPGRRNGLKRMVLERTPGAGRGAITAHIRCISLTWIRSKKGESYE